MGFTFDDRDTKGVATPVAEMRKLINQRPSNVNVIFPYIGGEEINSSPDHKIYRYVVNFGERSQEECHKLWPELLKVIETKVKPERIESVRKSKSGFGTRAGTWWQHYHTAKNLYSAVADLKRVIAISRIGNAFALTFLPSGTIYNEKTVIFPFERAAPFAVLQSRVHETWTRFFSSTLKDDLQYTPSRCFETFPFPQGWETLSGFEANGEAYYDFRAALMVENDEGLTKTYNRFHNPEERDPRIAELRELHAAMDRAVLDAYGWRDIPTDCEFLLDYEIDEETWGRKKKPYRYRWPDAVRDEVLARLLALNAKRAREERLARLRDAG